MAIGTTLERFENAGFNDADPSRQPTKGPFNIDHIVYRGLAVVAQSTHSKNFLSDHCGVSARFRSS